MWPAWRDVSERLVVYEATHAEKKNSHKSKELCQVLDKIGIIIHIANLCSFVTSAGSK